MLPVFVMAVYEIRGSMSSGGDCLASCIHSIFSDIMGSSSLAATSILASGEDGTTSWGLPSLVGGPQSRLRCNMDEESDSSVFFASRIVSVWRATRYHWGYRNR